jgi:hypothetical protein
MPNFNRSARKNINLVRKMRRKSVNDGSLVWFIGKRQNCKTFYVADYDDNNTIMWTADKKDGISFKTERAVHRFIHKNLNDRTDIFLIHAPRN